MTNTSGVIKLKAALGQHAHVLPLKDGRVKSDRVTFEFVEFNPLPAAFRQMLRGDDLDISEMAIVSHLLGVDHGRAITALPVTLWGRVPHSNLMCRTDAGIHCPADLDGTRIGVRAYAQTSGVWVRGVLAAQYGVQLDSIRWITQEDAHVPEYHDPSNVTRAAPGLSLRDLMQAGEVQAIMGERIVDPAGVRTVIEDADAVGRRWCEQQGIVPINHIITVRRRLFDDHPWLAGELMQLFVQSRQVAERDGDPLETGAIVPPYGLAANRHSLDTLFDYTFTQNVTRRRYRVEEIFTPV